MDSVVSIKTLRPWDKNPRSITASGLARLKKQIAKLGQYKPLLVTDDGVILGGNMRYRAYLELGVEEVWVSVVSPKNEDEMLEYALSDNDRAGYYDEDMLANLIPNYNIDWSEYSVDLKEPTIIADLLDQFKEVEEDEAPELNEQSDPVSRLGEVYQLGRHRLMCGDSTRLDHIEALMGDTRADMVFTDPPYLMKFDGSVHADGTKSANSVHGTIKNDNLTEEQGLQFLRDTLSVLNTYNKGAFYICFYRLGLHWLFQAMSDVGLKYRNVIIWKKNNFTLSNSDYKSTYEPLVYGWADDYQPIMYGWNDEHNFFGARGERDVWELESVWEIDRTKKNDLHSTMKPIHLCARAILNSSKPDDVVLDLFGGSGSTLIACEQLGRSCYLNELEPRYCDVIRKRYAKYIGKEEEWQDITPIITGKEPQNG